MCDDVSEALDRVPVRSILPERNMRARRKKANVPDIVIFQTKPHIALDQIAAALAARAPRGVVLADAAYGTDGAFRAALARMGLSYSVGVHSNTSVWPPGVEPLPVKEWSGHGRKPSLARQDADHKPVLAKALAMSLSAGALCDASGIPVAKVSSGPIRPVRKK